MNKIMIEHAKNHQRLGRCKRPAGWSNKNVIIIDHVKTPVPNIPLKWLLEPVSTTINTEHSMPTIRNMLLLGIFGIFSMMSFITILLWALS